MRLVNWMMSITLSGKYPISLLCSPPVGGEPLAATHLVPQTELEVAGVVDRVAILDQLALVGEGRT